MNSAKQSKKLFPSCTWEVNEKKDLNEFQELLWAGTGVESVGNSSGENVAKYFSSIACEKIPTAYRSYLGKRVSLRFLCKVEPESCFPRDDRDSPLIKKEEIDYSINNNETLVSLRCG